jgi:hypothetical protein
MKLYWNLILFGLMAAGMLPVMAQADQEATPAKPTEKVVDEDSSTFTNKRLERLEFKEKLTNPAPEKNVSLPPLKLDYQSVNIPFKPPVIQPKLEPVKREQVRWPQLYNHSAKLGLGLFVSPFAEVNLNGGRAANHDWGIRYRHWSSITGHTEHAQFADNQLQLKGQILNPHYMMYGKVDLQHHRYNFFGRKRDIFQFPEDEAWKSAIAQRVMRVGFETGIRNHYDTKGFQYQVPVRMQLYNDRINNQEWMLGVFPTFEFGLLDSLRLNLSQGLSYGATKAADVRNGQSQGQLLLDATPTVVYRKSLVRAYAGFRANVANDSSQTFFNIYPIAHADFVALPKHLTIYAGVSGQTIQNYRYNLITQNPYLGTRAFMAPTMERFRLYVGAKGGGSGVDFDVSAYMRTVERQAVFFTSPIDSFYFGQEVRQGEFNVLYANRMKQTGVSVNVQYRLKEEFSIGSRIEWSTFSIDSLPAFFHEPNIRCNIFGQYTYQEKIVAGLRVNYIGSRVVGIDREQKLYTEKGFVDVNLSGEYRISNRFSIFVEFNNLLSQSYRRWNQYIERPLDIRAGVMIGF